MADPRVAARPALVEFFRHIFRDSRMTGVTALILINDPASANIKCAAPATDMV
jgi:hypothetical protein